MCAFFSCKFLIENDVYITDACHNYRFPRNQLKYVRNYSCLPVCTNSISHSIKPETRYRLAPVSDLLLNKYDCDFKAYYLLYNSIYSERHVHSSSLLFADPSKPSSKIEETVNVLKDKANAREHSLEECKPANVIVKKSLKQKVVDELVHYYHGFRLLFIDIRVSATLVWRILNGKHLSRREHNLVS